MSKVLLLGHAPPPLVSRGKIEAAHYRTWQFLEPLLEDGHTIGLCVDGGDGTHLSSPPAHWPEHLTLHAIPFRHRLGWVAALQRVHAELDPDCIVAVNFDLCLCATKLRTTKPIWMDIYGDYFTILQAAFHRRGSNRGLATSLRFARRVLATGDAFSACGVPQQHALVGELAMHGRLSARTFGYPFAHVVRAGSPPVDGPVPRRAGRAVLASAGVAEDTFAVLWCGSYNTWTDVDTLFAGLEWAMDRVPNLHFVSLGASSYEAPRTVYEQFSALVDGSRHRQRYHLLGWRPWEEMAGFYRECDVGLNIDAFHYETVYGTRTRLVEMIGHGLPVVTTLGSELSELLATANAGWTFEIGDAQALGNGIVTLAREPEKLARMADSGRRYAAAELSFGATTAALRQWVRDPRKAPDAAEPDWRERLRRAEYATRSIVRETLWRLAGLDR